MNPPDVLTAGSEAPTTPSAYGRNLRALNAPGIERLAATWASASAAEPGLPRPIGRRLGPAWRRSDRHHLC